jgi:hypothetical protein
MAQPAQIFTPNDPSNGYQVIDNGVPNVTITGATSGLQYTQNNDGGFDNTNDANPFRGGAVAQSKDAFGNGNIPDFVQNGKSFTCATAGVFNIISYKLPS